MKTVELCKKLIKYQSTSEKYHNCVSLLEYIKSYISRHNPSLFIRNYQSKGVKSILFSTQKHLDFKLLLVGHLDVVLGNPKIFMPFERKGKLYGRGSADMKGPVSAMIQSIISAGDDVNIGLYLATDEEEGGFNGSGHFSKIKELNYEILFMPDGLPNWTLTIGQKGFVIFKLISKGISCHGCEPWRGDNAIDKLIDIYTSISNKLKRKHLLKPEDDSSEKFSLNLSRIHGGEAVNQVPFSAEMTLDFRYYKKSDRSLLFKIINNEIRKTNGIKYEICFEGNPLYLSLKNNRYQKFMNILKKFNINPVLRRELGSSDARFFSKYKACIIFMPVCGGAHENKEWIDIKSLWIFEKIIRELISMKY